MDLRLKAKLALVTGGSRGIGRAVAESLAAEGCKLHLASRKLADLQQAQKEITARHGVEVAIHDVDLADQNAVVALAAACGGIDILINNAGAIPSGKIDAIDDQAWRLAWDLKVFGYIGLMREVLPAMQRRGSGVIVNIIGTGGERPTAGYIVGAGGNAALMAMTRALGTASVDHGVRVLGVNPGIVTTERGKRLIEQQPDFAKSLPFGRAAKPQEVADLVCFLASERASYISGTIVTIDGGVSGRTA